MKEEMKLSMLLVILLKSVGCNNDDFKLIFNIIETIARDHYFDFYMLLFSNKESDKSFYDRIAKLTKEGFGYSTIVQLPIEEYGTYFEKSEDNKRLKCLKMLNAKSDKVKEAFTEVSKECQYFPLFRFIIFRSAFRKI